MPRVLGDAFVRVRADPSMFSRDLSSSGSSSGRTFGRLFGRSAAPEASKPLAQGTTAVATTAGQSSGKRFGSSFAKGILAGGAVIYGVKAIAGGLADMGKAAIEDAAGQRRLSIALQNTTGATKAQVAQVEGWIAKQGVALGVTDDELRPAMQRLVQATGDVGKAQELASLSMDVASGSGKSLKQVTEAMVKAQNGSVGGLSRLGVATKDAAGNTLSFEQIQRKLAETFRGQAAKGAETAEGRFKRMQLVIDETKETIGGALIPVATTLAGVFLSRVVPAIQQGVKWVGQELVPRLREFWEGLKVSLLPALSQLGDFLVGTVVPALGRLAGFIGRNSDLIVPLAAVLGTAIVAFRVISGLVLLWAKRQVILNAVLTANPIGVVIAVLAALAIGITIAYKRSDTFRAIVQNAWKRIQAAVNTAWNGFIKPALQAFGRFLTNVVGPAIQWLWQNIVRPYFTAVGRLIKAVWQNVIAPALRLWWAYMRNVLFPVLRFLWENVVKPVFGWVGDKIRDTWTKFIRPAFTAIRAALGVLRDAFRTTVSKIGEIWEGLREKARQPVEFVVNTVFAGMARALNKIPGVELPVPHFAKGGPVPMFGGAQRGKDSVRAMLMPDEHVWTTEEVKGVPGGHKGVKRLRELAKKRRLKLTGDPGWDLAPGFAEGGMLPVERVAAALRYARAQAGKPYIWGDEGPRGFDCSGFMSGITNVLRGGSGYGVRYGTTATFPWPGFRPGWGEFTIGNSKSLGHMGGTLLGLGVEATNGSVRVGSAARGAGHSMFDQRYHLGRGGEEYAAAGGGGNPLARFMDAIKAIKDFAGKVNTYFSTLADMGGWGGLVRNMAKAVIPEVRSWVNEKVPGPGPWPSFDMGGRARGRGYMFKGTLEPERTLSPRQTEAFERLVELLDNGLLSRGPLVNVERMETKDDRAAARELTAEFQKVVTMLGTTP